MKWLADENVEKAIIDLLRKRGFDVKVISEVSPRLEDEAVLAIANREDRLLLTNDKDFGELVFLRREISQGILLLRFRTEDSTWKAQQLGKFLESYSEPLTGKFVVLREGGVRIRKLSGAL